MRYPCNRKLPKGCAASGARFTDAPRAALAALLLRKRRALHGQLRAAPLLGEQRDLYSASARVKS